MKVLYIAAECKPFSKVGGVGDVAGELPPALKDQGIDIEIVTPLYGKIESTQWRETSEIYSFDIHDKRETVQICEGELRGVPVCFLKNNTYFEGHYSEPYIYSEKIPFQDDVLRFSFFSEACLHLIRKKKPDIVHINDWVLGYLFGRMVMEKMPQGRVMTVHNIGYQGTIWKGAVKDSKIQELARAFGSQFDDPNYRDPETDEPNCFNALRLGLELCHMANTVSPNYCLEITQPEAHGRYFEGGKGLDETAARLYREGRLIGIVNGFDYAIEPTEEAFSDALDRKASMKRDLSRCFGNPDHFLLGFVGRAVEQKFGLLTETIEGKSVLEHILDIPGINVAILATGLREYESFINNISVERFSGHKRYEDLVKLRRRDNYSFMIAYDPAKARQISLGSDVFLMPSLFEPCGITQLESLSNATPPLVRWTGGLLDTVKPYTQPDGTGFGFDGASKWQMLYNLIKAVEEARAFYKDNPSGFRGLQRNGFEQRFDWRSTAKKYVKEVYQPVMKDLRPQRNTLLSTR